MSLLVRVLGCLNVELISLLLLTLQLGTLTGRGQNRRELLVTLDGVSLAEWEED